jgi:hypothetical protein
VFRQIIQGVNRDQLLRQPPIVLSALMELGWQYSARGRGIGGPPALPLARLVNIVSFGNIVPVFDHLIYAYLIEQTKIFEVFGRVIREYAFDEKLSIARRPGTYDWLRATEDLFYSNGSPFIAASITSHIRPDPRAMRRNAYYRMFGLDLNHGTPDGGPYPYEKAAVANREFIASLETFLREVWRAIENSRNVAGADPTDPAAAAELAFRLQTMLNERRGGLPTDPNLAREEFAAVAAMAWLDVTVGGNTDVVQDLQAAGTTPDERLRRIGERVGVPMHAQAHSYFILAPAMSTLLTQVEAGFFSNVSGVQSMWLPANNTNFVRNNVMTIVDHWSRVTGRNIKAVPTSPTAAAVRAPMRAPAPATAPIPGAGQNGGGIAMSPRQLAKV